MYKRQELYLLASKLLEVSSDKIFAIEDSPNGVKAAQAAGICCVAVPNPITRNMDLSFADVIIDSLSGVTLEEIMQEL